MTKQLMPPIGIEDFRKMRTEGFYYVDKTDMIKGLLENQAEVTLFTRPRRFGKTLTMSMLRRFFEIGTDPALFDGLAISREEELCAAHMGQYPVISITLKEVQGLNFEEARRRMAMTVSNAAKEVSKIVDGDQLDDEDRNALAALRRGEGALDYSLNFLSELLSQHYGKKAVLLIDEYDVPLNAADIYGYYDEMVSLIRSFLGAGLKTNGNLAFAVLTGCLRVSKESIFTGLNNLKVYSVINMEYRDCFGFTDAEVQDMLRYYGVSQHYGTTKAWYDGYRIGGEDIYCPWDVVNWCSTLRNDPNPRPENFWANSSGNDIILKFAEMADTRAKGDMERLAAGETVTKQVHMELTYRELYNSIDNIWSVLLNTGYLTCVGVNDDGGCKLAIPNREISDLFRRMLDDWFYRRMMSREGGLNALYQALEDGDAEVVESEIRRCLAESISFMDGGNSAEKKEMFYHGFLLGLLKGCPDWLIESNRETGNGRADIVAKNFVAGVGFIIEVKYAPDIDLLDERAAAALSQIEEKRYSEYFRIDGVKTVYKYGISFYRKGCRVAMGH